MSYRNPEQIVDTQSGQYIREMQKSVAASYGKMAKEISAKYEQARKENLAREIDANKRVSKLSNDIFAKSVNNYSIDYTESSNQMLEEYNVYAKKDPTRLTSEERLFMRNVDNLGTTIKAQLENTSMAQQEYLEAAQIGVGNYGGLDAYNNPKVLKRNDIMYNWKSTPGSKQSVMDCSGLDGCKIDIYALDEEGNTIGSVINQGQNISEARIIPNPTKDIENINKDILAIDFKNSASDVFKGSDFIVTPDGVGGYKKSKIPDREFIKKRIKQNADTYIKSTLDTQEAISLYNNKYRGNADIIDPDKSSWDKDEDGNVNDEDLKKIQEAFTEHIVSTTPEYNKIQDFGVASAKDYKPNSYDKKEASNKESAKLIVDDLRRYARERKLPNAAVNFGQGVEEITSTIFQDPAEENGMGKVKIFTTTKSGQKAGEYEDLERTIDLDTKDGMMQYVKAVIKAGEGSSSEKNAKLEAIRKILSKKSGGKYDNL
jgi:hypothetical protein